MAQLPGSTSAETDAIIKWYAAARAALARNRPLTIGATQALGQASQTDLTAAEAAALRGVGALMPVGTITCRTRGAMLLHKAVPFSTALPTSTPA